jgi:hypothetical protein
VLANGCSTNKQDFLYIFFLIGCEGGTEPLWLADACATNKLEFVSSWFWRQNLRCWGAGGEVLMYMCMCMCVCVCVYAYVVHA